MPNKPIIQFPIKIVDITEYNEIMTGIRQEMDNNTTGETLLKRGPSEPIKMMGSAPWLRRMQTERSRRITPPLTKVQPTHPLLYDDLTEAEQIEEVQWEIAIGGIKSLMSEFSGIIRR